MDYPVRWTYNKSERRLSVPVVLRGDMPRQNAS